MFLQISVVRAPKGKLSPTASCRIFCTCIDSGSSHKLSQGYGARWEVSELSLLIYQYCHITVAEFLGCWREGDCSPSLKLSWQVFDWSGMLRVFPHMTAPSSKPCSGSNTFPCFHTFSPCLVPPTILPCLLVYLVSDLMHKQVVQKRATGGHLMHGLTRVSHQSQYSQVFSRGITGCPRLTFYSKEGGRGVQHCFSNLPLICYMQ